MRGTTISRTEESAAFRRLKVYRKTAVRLTRRCPLGVLEEWMKAQVGTGSQSLFQVSVRCRNLVYVQRRRLVLGPVVLCKLLFVSLQIVHCYYFSVSPGTIFEKGSTARGLDTRTGKKTQHFW